ncbi:MAG: hypothetical protein ACK5Q7_12195 [Cyanobacteriota bacterium]
MPSSPPRSANSNSRPNAPRNPTARRSNSRSAGGAKRTGRVLAAVSGVNGGEEQAKPLSDKPSRPVQMVISTGAEALSLNEEKRELVCSLIGLTVKIGLVVMAGVSLCRLAGAYQERMDRQGELAAVLEIEKAQLAKARDRFDQLFMVAGEQKLIREQSQWIAPNRLRVVWQSSDPLQDRPALAMQRPDSPEKRP